MGNSMADHFLSFMVFIFKAIFPVTLKFQLCRYFSLRRVEQFALCPMKIHHAVSEKSNDKLFFLKMLSLRGK